MPNDEKMPLREALQRQIKAMRQIHRLDPQLFPALALDKLLTAILPYVLIYLSAQILNELAGPRRPDTLRFWVLLSVGLIALLGLLQAFFHEWANVRNELAHLHYRMTYFHKQWTMDFADMDRPALHDLRTQIQQNENWGSFGFGIAVSLLPNLVESVVGILSALLLSMGLFFQRVPDHAPLQWLNHPIFPLGLLGLMLLLSLLSARLYGWCERKVAQMAQHARFGNRVFSYFGFFGGDQRDADIRFYQQYSIARHFFEATSDQGFGLNGPFARFDRGRGGFVRGLSAGLSAVFTFIIYLFTCLKALAGAFGIGSITQYVGAATTLSRHITLLFSTLSDMQTNGPFLAQIDRYLSWPHAMEAAPADAPWGKAELEADVGDEVGAGAGVAAESEAGAALGAGAGVEIGAEAGSEAGTGTGTAQAALQLQSALGQHPVLTFSDVSFRYPDTENWTLRHVNLRIPIDQRLAIVGENGSGKTTFIKLLCRLYDPQEGQILLNGRDIRTYPLAQYRALFSIVFQDFQLLSQPLAANVAGRFSYDAARVRDALKKAGLADRLQTLPEGLDTQLYRQFGDNGVEISGGEAQKIAIARALYRPAPFLILDEPTAALDPIAEAEIYAQLNEIVQRRTAIYISHRLSSCRFCDQIWVFDHGQVVQQGPHDQLLQDANGPYHRLWQAQAQYYANAPAAEGDNAPATGVDAPA